MKTILYAALILFFSPLGTAHAAGKCTAPKLAATQRKVAAVMKADSVKTNEPWAKLRGAFNGNRDCMAVFETYDFGEAIRHSIKNHWGKIGELEKYKKEDNKFFLFVISGLKDETANIEDIKGIHELAETKCPSGVEALCKEIAENSTVKP